MKSQANLVVFVLDTSLGQPAAMIPVTLDELDEAGRWIQAAAGVTDRAGGIDHLAVSRHNPGGTRYRLMIETVVYFQQRGLNTLFPVITIEFVWPTQKEFAKELVLPLLISPNAYTTYRGS